MAYEEKTTGLMDNETSAMKRIVMDHKVFWTTLPIELPGNTGRPLKVGMALALVGTDAESGVAEVDNEKPTVYDKLFQLAQLLISGNQLDVRFEIRRHDNVVFYLPESLKTNRKDFVVIRILHSDQFNLPLDKKQLKVLSEFEKSSKKSVRLRNIGKSAGPVFNA